MKTLSIIFVSSIISLSAMGMGYPTSTPYRATKKATQTVKVEKTNSATWEAVEVNPENVSTEDEAEKPKSTVNLVSKVIVKLFDMTGKLLKQKNMSKTDLLTDQHTEFLKGSHFATITNNVAYYFVERKED